MTQVAALAPQPLVSRQSHRRREWERWIRTFRRPARVLAAMIILGIVCVAVLAPLLALADPALQDISARLRPPLTSIQGRSYLLGSDQLGRDIVSRLIYGARISLIVGLASVAIAGAVGAVLGLVSGYFGGRTDQVLMRVADVQMAFPFILLALIIVAVLGPSLQNVIIVFGITSWVIYARTIRGVTLALREQEFVSAARALGATDLRILVRHVFPNVANPMIVIGSFEVARIVSSEAALSFLGLGIPPIIPTWGSMISDGREYLQSAWWIASFPGLALALLVVAVNIIGDGLRDALDPRSKVF